MKIKLPHDSTKFQGGGSTFIANFTKAINKYGHQVLEGNDCSVYFIAGATLADRGEVIQAKKDGKTIVLRVDNILEDRKNRNSGMTRLRDYAELADVIVYQSEWAKKLLSPLLGNGVVIYNGVDTDIFYPRKTKKDWEGIRIFYSKYSRNEVKQFHEVQYWWREYNLEKRGDTLVLVGRFADDYLHIDHPFDFHNDELYEYRGVIEDPHKLADIMRSCDIAFLPYQYDACSNTILEAQACGLPVIHSQTGGTPEIVDFGEAINYQDTPAEQVARMVQYLEPDMTNFQANFSLDTMGEMYHALLTTVTSNTYEV